jgi:hypothetical protein
VLPSAKMKPSFLVVVAATALLAAACGSTEDSGEMRSAGAGGTTLGSSGGAAGSAQAGNEQAGNRGGADAPDAKTEVVDAASTVDVSTDVDADRVSDVLVEVCVPAPENCFNNIDDDCDGHIDCADPDCTGGVSPEAICVADPGTFTPGVVLPVAAICPDGWPTSTIVSSDIIQGCGNGTCGCTTPRSSCGAYLYAEASNLCPHATSAAFVDQAVPCATQFTIPQGTYHSVGTPEWLGDCGAPMGAAFKATPYWFNTEKLCGGGLVGAGCASGSICVPRGSNHCAMKAGSQLECPGGYLRRTRRYYTGIDDSSRSCQCACSVTSPGSCSGTPTMDLWDSAVCSGSHVTVPGSCSSSDVSSAQYASLSGLAVTAPMCEVEAKQIGSATLTGEQTICCTP